MRNVNCFFVFACLLVGVALGVDLEVLTSLCACALLFTLNTPAPVALDGPTLEEVEQEFSAVEALFQELEFRLKYPKAFALKIKQEARREKRKEWHKKFGFCPALCWASVSKEELFVAHEEDFSFLEFLVSGKKFFATCGKENNKSNYSILRKLFPWKSTAKYVWIKEFRRKIAVSLKEKEGWVRLGNISQIEEENPWFKEEKGVYFLKKEDVFVRNSKDFNIEDFYTDRKSKVFATCGAENNRYGGSLWNLIANKEEESYLLEREVAQLEHDWRTDGMDIYIPFEYPESPVPRVEENYHLEKEVAGLYYDWVNDGVDICIPFEYPEQEGKLLYFKELTDCYAFSIYPVEGWEHLGEDNFILGEEHPLFKLNKEDVFVRNKEEFTVSDFLSSGKKYFATSGKANYLFGDSRLDSWDKDHRKSWQNSVWCLLYEELLFWKEEDSKFQNKVFNSTKHRTLYFRELENSYVFSIFPGKDFEPLLDKNALVNEFRTALPSYEAALSQEAVLSCEKRRELESLLFTFASVYKCSGNDIYKYFSPQVAKAVLQSHFAQKLRCDLGDKWLVEAKAKLAKKGFSNWSDKEIDQIKVYLGKDWALNQKAKNNYNLTAYILNRPVNEPIVARLENIRCHYIHKSKVHVKPKKEFDFASFQKEKEDAKKEVEWFATCGEANVSAPNSIWAFIFEQDREDAFYDAHMDGPDEGTIQELELLFGKPEKDGEPKKDGELEKDRLLYFKELEDFYLFSIFPVEGWEHLGDQNEEIAEIRQNLTSWRYDREEFKNAFARLARLDRESAKLAYENTASKWDGWGNVTTYGKASLLAYENTFNLFDFEWVADKIAEEAFDKNLEWPSGYETIKHEKIDTTLWIFPKNRIFVRKKEEFVLSDFEASGFDFFATCGAENNPSNYYWNDEDDYFFQEEDKSLWNYMVNTTKDIFWDWSSEEYEKYSKAIEPLEKEKLLYFKELENCYAFSIFPVEGWEHLGEDKTTEEGKLMELLKEALEVAWKKRYIKGYDQFGNPIVRSKLDEVVWAVHENMYSQMGGLLVKKDEKGRVVLPYYTLVDGELAEVKGEEANIPGVVSLYSLSNKKLVDEGMLPIGRYDTKERDLNYEAKLAKAFWEKYRYVPYLQAGEIFLTPAVGVLFYTEQDKITKLLKPAAARGYAHGPSHWLSRAVLSSELKGKNKTTFVVCDLNSPTLWEDLNKAVSNRVIAENPFKTETLCKLWGNNHKDVLPVLNVERLEIEMDGNSICSPNVAKMLNLTEDNCFQVRACLQLSDERQTAINLAKALWRKGFRGEVVDFEKTYNETLKAVGDTYRKGIVSNTETAESTVENLAQFYCKGLLTPCRALKPGFVLLDVNNMFKTGQKVDMKEACEKFGALNITSKAVLGVLQDYGTGSMKQGSQPVNYSVAWRSKLADAVVDGTISEEEFDLALHTTSHLYPMEDAINRFDESIVEAIELFSTGTDPRSAVDIAKGKDVDKENVNSLNFWNHATNRALMIKEQQSFLNGQPYTTQTELWKKLGMTMPKTGYMADWINASVIPPMALVKNPYFVGKGTYEEGEIKIGAMQRCTGPELIPAVPVLWGTRGAWDVIADAFGYEPDYILGDALRYPTSGPQVYTNIIVINPFKYEIGIDHDTRKPIFASDIFACNAFIVNPWVSKNIFTGDTDGDTVAWRAYFTPKVKANIELETIKLPSKKVRGGQLDILRSFYAPDNYKPQAQIAKADLVDEVTMPVMKVEMPSLAGKYHNEIHNAYPDTMVLIGIHDEATWTYEQSFVEDALGGAKSKAGDIKLDEYRLATLDAQPGMVALFQGYIKEYMDVYFTNTHLWTIKESSDKRLGALGPYFDCDMTKEMFNQNLYQEMTKVFYASAMVFLEGTIMGMKKDTQPQLSAEMGKVARQLMSICNKYMSKTDTLNFLSNLLGAGWDKNKEFVSQKWWTKEEKDRKAAEYAEQVRLREQARDKMEQFIEDGKDFSIKVNASTFEAFATLMEVAWVYNGTYLQSKLNEEACVFFDPYRKGFESKLRNKSFAKKIDTESAFISEDEKWGILENPFGEYHIEKGAQGLLGSILANHSQIHSKNILKVREMVENMTNRTRRERNGYNKCITNPDGALVSPAWSNMFRGVDVERGAVTSWSSKKENVLNELYILDILKKALKPNFTAYFSGGAYREKDRISTGIWVNLKRYMDSIKSFDFEDEAARTKNLSKFFLLWIVMETVHNYKTETFEVDGKLTKIARNPNLDSFEDGLYYAKNTKKKSMTQTFGMILNEISELNLTSGVFANTDVYMNALSKKIDLHCKGINGKPHWFWKVFKAFGLKEAFVAELKKEILLVKDNVYAQKPREEEPICLFADFSLSFKKSTWYIYTKTGADARKPYGLLRPAAPFTKKALTMISKKGWVDLEKRISSSILPITRKLKYLKSTMPTPLKEECWIVGNDNTAKSIPFGRNITHDLFSASFLTRIGLEVQQSRTATKQGGVENTVAVLTTKAFAKKFKNSNTMDARKLLIPNMIEFGKTIFNAEKKKESVLSMKEYTFVPKYTKEGDTEVHYFDLIHKKTGLLHGYVIGFDRISAVNARNALGKSVVFTKGKDFDVLSFQGDEWAMFNAKASILKNQWNNEVDGEAVAEFQKSYGANNRPDESKDAKYFTSESLAMFTFNFEARDPAAAIHDTMHQLEEIYLKEGKEAVDAKVRSLEVGFNPYRYRVEKANVIGKDKNTYELLICEYALENNTSKTELGYHYARAKSETGEDIKVAKYLVTFSMNEIALEHSPTLERFVGTFNNKIERQFIYSIKEMSSDEVEQYYGYDEFVSAEEYFEEKSTPVESEADINALLAGASYENNVQHEYQNFNQDDWTDYSSQEHPSYEDYSQHSQDFGTNNEESHNSSVQPSLYYDDCNHCEYEAQEESWENNCVQDEPQAPTKEEEEKRFGYLFDKENKTEEEHRECQALMARALERMAWGHNIG